MNARLIECRTLSLCNLVFRRNFSGTSPLCTMTYKKKRRQILNWFRKYPQRGDRFPFKTGQVMFPDDLGPDKEGGSVRAQKILEGREDFPRDPGYHDKDGNFVFVEEMIPEFIVPDLSKCELKPYVSYTAKDIEEPPLSAKELFKEVYGRPLEADYVSGRILLDDIEKKQAVSENE